MNGAGKVESFEDLYTLFEQRCTAKGVKDSSMNSYRVTMGRFIKWADGNGIRPDQLDSLDMLAYTGNLTREDGKPYKLNTLATHARDLKTLIGFAVDYGIMAQKVKIETPKISHGEPKALNDEELAAVFKHFEDQAERNPRNAAICHLLIDTGIRAAELCALNWEDLGWDNERQLGTARITKQLLRNGEFGSPKNGEPRKVYFTAATWKYLQAIRAKFPGEAHPGMSPREIWHSGYWHPSVAVFWNHARPGVAWEESRLGARGLDYILRTAGKKLGIALHAHTFRHTCGRLMSIRDMPPQAMKSILGHSSLQMVEHYTRLWGSDVEDLYAERMNGNGK